jgi:hypothetical protein
MTRTCIVLALGLALVAACGDPGGGEDANELITRVELTFTPAGGDTAQTFRFDDDDGDGGYPGMSEPIMLAPGMYELAVTFQNALEDPPEDITLEVRDEAIEHQVFFTGSSVVGPATANTLGPLMHSYADADDNGLPVGLASTIAASPGSGDLIVTLRHMPPEEPPEKAADSAANVAAGGFSAIGGSTDAQVTFSVSVP